MRFLPWALGIVAIAACPFLITSPYYLHLLVTIAIFAIVTLGLDVVFGYTGEVSIGHALISRAVFVGLDRVVREYLAVLNDNSL